MIGPANPRQRLILAAAVAFVLDFAPGLLAARLLPARLQAFTAHGNGFIQPATCVVLAISLFFGGWIGGRRFLPIGVALVLLLQLMALALLVQIAHGAMPQRPLSVTAASVVAGNVPGLGLQLLAAALGALAGAAVHRRRPLPPLPIQESP